jgi:hypothetical protein
LPSTGLAVPSGHAKSHWGIAPQLVPPLPPVPPPPGAGAGEAHCPLTQASPARTALQSASTWHSAMQTGWEWPQSMPLTAAHSATFAFGHADGSVHAFVQVPQMHCNGPHSASLLQRSSQ